MTKAELEQELKDWKTTAESLQEELDALNEAYCELEDKNFKLSNNINSGIKNVEDFIFRMKCDGYWTVEIQNFIDMYIKFYNNQEVYYEEKNKTSRKDGRYF